MLTLPLFALRRMAETIPFLPPFFPPPEISSFWGTSTALTPSGTQEVLPTPMGKKYSTGSSFVTSFPLNDPDIPTLLHRSFPDISLLPSLSHFPAPEVMKIARLTSPLPDVLRLSLPRLRNGRQLALLSRPNLTLNLYTLFFTLSLALLSLLQTSPTVPLLGSRLRSSPIS